MKTIKIYLMTLMLMVFSSLSLASEAMTPVEKGQSLSEIKTELIENLKNDGLITGENATIALQNMVILPLNIKSSWCKMILDGEATSPLLML